VSPNGSNHLISRYFHTGGFSRLKGQTMAPGSVRPAGYFFRRRLIYCLVAGGFLLISLWFVLF